MKTLEMSQREIRQFKTNICLACYYVQFDTGGIPMFRARKHIKRLEGTYINQASINDAWNKHDDDQKEVAEVLTNNNMDTPAANTRSRAQN